MKSIGNPVQIQWKYQWNSNENQFDIQYYSIETEINWKSSWNFNEKQLKISIIFQWKSIGYPVEISMKYKWKSIGNPVEIQ